MKIDYKNPAISFTSTENMKKLICFLFVLSFGLGCSKDEIAIVPIENGDGTYFHLKVNGADIPLITGHNVVNFQTNKTLIYFNVDFGFGIQNSPGLNRLAIVFDRDGKFMEAHQQSMDVGENNYTINYKNYKNFPANYFHITIISINEVTKRIKFTVSGKLYSNDSNLDSESIDLEGDFDLKYTGDLGTTPPAFQTAGMDQHCTAKLNGTQWTALRELVDGEFTAEDPYKIEIKFPLTATVGSYNLISNSSINYLRFSKFNTVTKVFDYYNVSGVLNQSYREFHGAGNYSLFGTFSFTALNPNNPSDVIQVTDGSFRSYQHY